MIYNHQNIKEDDIEQICFLHSISLPDSIITLLGKTIIKRYYNYVINVDKEILFFIKENEKVLGSCLISIKPETLMKRFLLRHWDITSIFVMKALISSSTKRKRILNFLLKKSNKPSEINGMPEIVQIYTNPAIKNQKVGTRLLIQAEEFLVNRKIEKYFLKTFSSDDNQALHFYNRRNFKKIAEIELGKRKYIYFIKDLGTFNSISIDL